MPQQDEGVPLLPETFTGVKGCGQKIFAEIFSAAVLIPGLLNFVRDWIWTFFSYDLLNDRLHPTKDATFDAKGQWFSQQLYSTLAMFIALLAMVAFYKIKKPQNEDGELKKFPKAHGVIYLISAAVAVYGWDRMQVVGINVGQKQLKLSANDAAYFAALFTGLEGFMQFFVIVALRTLTLDEYYTPFKQDPKKFLKQFLAGMFCSLTFVACPGANWQIFFALGVLKNWGAILTSCAVASTVAFWNYTSVKISSLALNYLYQRAESHVEEIPEVISEDTFSDDEKANGVVQPGVNGDLSQTTTAQRNLSILQHSVVTDHLPSADNDNENRESSPLNRVGSSARNLGSGVFGAGSGFLRTVSSKLQKKLSGRNQPTAPTTTDPAFGTLVTEQSFTQ